VPPGVAGVDTGVNPRSLRCVGVSGISVISSAGAQMGCRDLPAPKRSRSCSAANTRDSRNAGMGEMELLKVISWMMTEVFVWTHSNVLSHAPGKKKLMTRTKRYMAACARFVHVNMPASRR
jgi:hypothetical protein